MNPFLARLFAYSLSIVLVVSGWGSSLFAQTLFEDPRGTVDVSQYKTMEECLALVARLETVWRGMRTINYDTMPPGVIERNIPWSPHIVENARRCSAQWDPQTVSPEDFTFLGTLFLIAGREADFSMLFARRLAAAADTTRAAVLDTAMQLMTSARPVRLHAVETIVWDHMMTLPDTGDRNHYYSKIGRLWSLRELAREVGNDTVAMRAAAKADSMFAGLTEEDRKSFWYVSPILGSVGKAKYNSAFVNFRERLDSLGRSTSAYLSLVRSQLDSLLKGEDPTDDLRWEIGAISPKVEGEFWFPQKPVASRPTRGKRSLVVPAADCRSPEDMLLNGSSAECWRWFSMIKRVHTQFPDVEITLVIGEEGRAILHNGESTVDEAEDLQRWFLKGARLPVTVVMEQADFVPLHKQDGRLVNTRWTMDTMESWGCIVDGHNYMGCYSVFLLDEKGILLGTFSKGDVEIGERSIVAMLTAMSRQAR